MKRPGDERVTNNMRSILEVVVRANRDGSWVDLDQLLQRVNYEVTKSAIQFTIRFMIGKGLIAKGAPVLRRGRNRVVFIPTDLGYQTVRRKIVGQQLEEMREIISDVNDVF